MRKVFSDCRTPPRDGSALVRLHLVEQLPQHVAEAEHGVDLQAVRLAGERRQRVVGAENVAGAVDQEDMVAFFERPRRRICGRMRGAALVLDLALAGMAANVGPARR